MNRKINIRNLVIGILVIVLGIWLIFFPTEVLQSYPMSYRATFYVIFILYGLFRIARMGQGMGNSRRSNRD